MWTATLRLVLCLALYTRMSSVLATTSPPRGPVKIEYISGVQLNTYLNKVQHTDSERRKSISLSSPLFLHTPLGNDSICQTKEEKNSLLPI